MTLCRFSWDGRKGGVLAPPFPVRGEKSALVPRRTAVECSLSVAQDGANEFTRFAGEPLHVQEKTRGIVRGEEGIIPR
jgi:hypothetical protein